MNETIRRVAETTGVTMATGLSDLRGGEVVKTSSLGPAEDVSQARMGMMNVFFHFPREQR